MIDPSLARRIAGDALLAPPVLDDPRFAAWNALTAAEPERVENLAGRPSYWVVPLLAGTVVVGFVRVMPDGEVAAIGLTCENRETEETCPRPAYALSAQEVAARAARAHRQPEETLKPPRLVHDGPEGREVWLVETSRDGKPHRWIFIAEAGSYVRPAGLLTMTDPENE